ncbi:ATP-binding protein [Mycoplasmopsis columboralis]|uniref:ATPase AAA n=1 Tax=Mycoplasmopsis columboralis TaxID=171282 RepID=A0A449B630_9BACT|nr:ATP-binding protein [Mycoplasmopsis columboralis]VEU76046.1 ATPase AAA [Mycoplasmopsis columboralis]
MKKENILNLIRYHAEKNEIGFREEAIKVAKYFDKNGDYELADYVMTLIAGANLFVPQESVSESPFLKVVPVSELNFLDLPENIYEKIVGILNAIKHNVGINKFLFEGLPGTGKTEAAKYIARTLNRTLLMVNFENVVDSRLGQTNKNIVHLFEKITQIGSREKIIVLFDEIDIIALDRINKNDLREMGRATSTILKELDKLNQNNSDVIIIGTTNLYKELDAALRRRFDAFVNFNKYEKEDLLRIAETYLNEYLKKFKTLSKDVRLFKKILNLASEIPYPGELKNLIRISMAFSNPDSEFDYLRKLYKNIDPSANIDDILELSNKGFTVREIEKLTGKSKSSVALKINKTEELNE